MKTWKISDIGLFFKNSIQAILKGEFLLRLNIGRYFVHIAYTFLLFGLVIWFSLMIETTMSKVEKNKAVLKELEIVHSQKRAGQREPALERGADARAAGFGCQRG